jgi:ATP-dependent protease ClpP protease subunit
MKKQNNEQEEMTLMPTSPRCIVREIQPPRYQYEYAIDTPIGDLCVYDELINVLRSASENDFVLLLINSPGGDLHTAQVLIAEIEGSAAYTIAYVAGEASSAASMIALACNELYATDDSTWLLHDLSTGVGGKSSDIVAYVDHMKKLSERIIKKHYTDFLSEADMQQILSGRQLYLFGDQIMDLWEARNNKRMEDAEQCSCGADCQGFCEDLPEEEELSSEQLPVKPKKKTIH